MDQKNPEILKNFLAITYTKYKNSTINPCREPIHIAAANDLLEVVKILVEQDAHLLNTTTIYNQTPLIFAAANGANQVVAYLIEQGANLDIQENVKAEIQGATALYWAINGKHKKTAIRLIDAGADLTKTTANSNFQPIHLAAREGQLDVIKAILTKNPNLLEQPDANHQTPLLWAAAEGHIDVVKYLAEEQTAQINVATTVSDNTEDKDHNKTALYWAIQNNHPKVIIFLINAGVAITPPAHLETLKNQLLEVNKQFQQIKSKNTNQKIGKILEALSIEATSFENKALLSTNQIMLLTTTLSAISIALENTNEDSLNACLRCAEKIEKNASFGKKLTGFILMLVGALIVATGFLLSIATTAATFGLATPIAAPAAIGIGISGALLAQGGAFLFFNNNQKEFPEHVKEFPEHVNDLVHVLENELKVH